MVIQFLFFNTTKNMAFFCIHGYIMIFVEKCPVAMVRPSPLFCDKKIEAIASHVN
jgi:hypothetical protein